MKCLRLRPPSVRAQTALWVLLLVPLALASASSSLLFAQAGPAGSIHGTVLDQSGGAVPNAAVEVVPAAGTALTATTNATGAYNLNNVPAGTYTIQVNVVGFAPYQKENVVVAAGRALQLDIPLTIQQQKEQVTVSGDALTLDTAASSNASQVVIAEKELDALPDDPDELQADLESLAGPGAGPNGGQMYIDGFTAGQLPPKSSIREIRINSNPFSAEYDQVGFGRIEILTKPGGGAWHGSISENNNSAIFNSRNPFALTRGNFESNQVNGNIGGGLGKHASLFFNADYRNIANSSVINAQILGPAPTFTPQAYQALFALPQYRLNIGPRLDWQVSKNNTLTVRYQYERNSVTNSGVGNLTLPTQASNALQTEDQLQITDTQYLGKRVVYETHFQFLHQPTSNLAANLIPSISVPGAFTGGGSGNVLDVQNRYELQSYASIAFVKHFVKFGARIRDITDSSNSNSAFFGAFQFSALTAYQTMVEGLANGLTMAQIIARPGCNTNGVSNGTCGPNQFSLTGGNPRAYVSMIDAGPFFEDTWKVRPNVSLSYGLRFETQNHIKDHMDWAPRVSVAWGLGGTKTTPKYVVRAGWGIFYTRFAEQNILQALRENGITEQQYIVTNPAFYCGPTTPGGTSLAGACPTPTQLAAQNSSVPTIYQISPTFHAPYLMQTSLSLERQLSKSVQLSFTYNNARGEDTLLEANVNAPVLPGTETPTPACVPPAVANCGVYPNGIRENIYQYESAGIFRQNQFFANVTIRPGPGRIWSKLTLNGFYVLNYADSTPNPANGGQGGGGGGGGGGGAQGGNGFVTNPYNILGDYGQAGGRFGTRDSVFLLGTISLPHGVALSPTLQLSSGAPYSVTLGKDLLGTSVLNQRPGIVSSAACATTQITGTVYCTPVGSFNVDPTAGEPIVPVNSLTGPAQFTINLRLTKTFTFGSKPPEGAARGGAAPAAPRNGFGGAGGPGGRPGFAPGPGGAGRRGANNGRSFTVSLNARNILNRVNFAAPIGVLGSSLFGQSESVSNVGAGGSVVANRQVYMQGTFNF